MIPVKHSIEGNKKNPKLEICGIFSKRKLNENLGDARVQNRDTLNQSATKNYSEKKKSNKEELQRMCDQQLAYHI